MKTWQSWINFSILWRNIRQYLWFLPCDIFEYDGAVKCWTHNRVWGSVFNKDKPCWRYKKECLIGLK
jgi:hypothetical protein